MAGERLSPTETVADIRKYIDEHPEGVNISPSALAAIARQRKWSDLVDPVRRITSGLKTLGVVRIEGLIAKPVPRRKH